jgi:putative tryptophan/tyrosine transport system substrate-binding protein
MKRRNFVALLGGGVALGAWQNVISQSVQMRRVGILAPGPLSPIKALKARLRELGWIEGKTIHFEERWGLGDDLSYNRLAADLVDLSVDIIVTWGTPPLLASKHATTKIPIVMASIGDPVTAGAVTNLAHPGGNVTGFSTENWELEEKRLELLRELVPGATRIVALGTAANPYVKNVAKRLTALAKAANLELQVIQDDTTNGVGSALSAVSKFLPHGVVVISAVGLFVHREEIVKFMARNRLPAVYPFPEFTEVGGLICYATDFEDLYRRAASYIDKILRGAAPGELPVEQASTFRLIVNLKAAQAMGLSIPPAVLARATEVIE